MKIKKTLLLGLSFLLLPNISWACIGSPWTPFFAIIFFISTIAFIATAVTSIISHVEGKKSTLVLIVILILSIPLIILTFRPGIEVMREYYMLFVHNAASSCF